jgi:hypothetical protein
MSIPPVNDLKEYSSRGKTACEIDSRRYLIIHAAAIGNPFHIHYSYILTIFRLAPDPVKSSGKGKETVLAGYGCENFFTFYRLTFRREQAKEFC